MGMRPLYFLLALALPFAGVAVTWDAWRDLLHAHDSGARFLFLVPLAAAWLVWVRRSRFQQCRRKWLSLGPLLAVSGGLLHALAGHSATDCLRHGGALLLVTGCLVPVVGGDALLRFSPAFAVFCFLVPLPAAVRHQVSLSVETLTTPLTAIGAELLGPEANLTGSALARGDAELRVAGDSDALDTVTLLTLVSFAFVFGKPLRNPVRFAIVALTPVFAAWCHIALVATTVGPGWLSPAAAVELGVLELCVVLLLQLLLLRGIVSSLRRMRYPMFRYTLALGS